MSVFEQSVILTEDEEDELPASQFVKDALVFDPEEEEETELEAGGPGSGSWEGPSDPRFARDENKELDKLKDYASSERGRAFLTNPAKRVLDEWRSEFKGGQLVVGDPKDPRLMLVAAFGGEPLKKASAFLGNKVHIEEATDAPTWARKLSAGGHHPGECYDMAGRFVLDSFHTKKEFRDQVTLVHGAIGNKETTAMFGHAWIEIGDKVVHDGVTGKFYPKDVYYHELQAVSEQRYTPSEAINQMRKKKFYGPWGPTLGVTGVRGDRRWGSPAARLKEGEK